MKQIMATVFAVTALGVTAQNGGTEVKDDFSTNTWGNWKSAQAVGTFQHSRDVGNKAPGSLEIRVGPGNPQKDSFVFTRAFPAQPGKTYRAAVVARGDGLAADAVASIAFQGQTAEGKFLGTGVQKSSLSGKYLDKWRAMSITLTIPSDGAWKNVGRLLCTLGIANASSGQVLFDDFIFTEVQMAQGYKDGYDSELWNTWKSPESVGMFMHNPEIGRQAVGALEIAVGPQNPVKASLCYLKHFPVQPGKTYNLLVWVQGKDLPADAKISMSVQGQDAEMKFLGTGVQGTSLTGENVPADDWKRMVFTFKVPDTGKWEKASWLLCTLGIGNAAHGRLFLDDFEFFEEK